jgi:NitT/TauT family transport system substrate-binding protein
MPMMQTRRRFLTTLSLAGAEGLFRVPRALAAERILETTSVRFAKIPGICNAPQYVAEELLQVEGFTDISYVGLVAAGAPAIEAVARSNADFTVTFAAPIAIAIDGGVPITVLSGVHVGCFELFGNDSVRSIADLKGKSVGVQGLGSSQHVFKAAMAAYVGLDPARTSTGPSTPRQSRRSFTRRARSTRSLAFHRNPRICVPGISATWSSTVPWTGLGRSISAACWPATATMSANIPSRPSGLRAVLKATDLCVTEPARAARRMVDGELTPRYDYALQTLSELPYDKWREYDAEDTIRFYALRLHEAGMIKSGPQRIIADGTDWRFLDELRRELKV